MLEWQRYLGHSPWPDPAHAAVGPLYDVKATWGDTNLTPGDSNILTAEGQFMLQVRNVGDTVGSGTLTVKDQLPAGVTATAIDWPGSPPFTCGGLGTGTVTCSLDPSSVAQLTKPTGVTKDFSFSPEPQGYLPRIFIDVSVPKAAKGQGTNTATVSGGGAPAPDTDTDQVPFSKTPADFGLVRGGFSADVSTAAYPLGAPARQAGSHPSEYLLDFDLTKRTGISDEPGGDNTRYTTPSGSLRTVKVRLPQGMIGNPEALPKCDPADFSEQGSVANGTGCPADTQVGYLNIAFNAGTTVHGTGGTLPGGYPGLLSHVPLYNLEPPRAPRSTSPSTPAAPSRPTSTRPSTPPTTTRSSRSPPTFPAWCRSAARR